MVPASSRTLKPALTFLLLTGTVAFGAVAETPVDPSDDFSPMMLAMTLIALFVVLLLFVIAVVLVAIAAVCSIILISLGIVSTAALTGLLRRKFSSGLRALHYQVCAAVGLPAGVAGFWGIAYLLGSEMPFAAILIIGGAAGICAGLVIAFVLDHAAGIAYRYYTKSKTPPQTPAIRQ